MANIPPPPPGDLGNIPPPPGFGTAYVPVLVAGGIMKKPEDAPEAAAPTETFIPAGYE